MPVILYLLILGMIFAVVLDVFGWARNNYPYSAVVELFQKEQVKSFVVQEQTITLTLHTPYEGETRITAPLADPELFREEMRPL